MGPLSIGVVRDDRALATLAPAWERLLAVTPLASSFQTLAWTAACRAPLAAGTLSVLVVRDGDTPVAIFPTELGAAGDLRFVGIAVSNYHGPVYLPDRLDDVATALASFLAAERRIRLLDLDGLREGSPALEALRDLAIPGWGPAHVLQTAVAPYIDLTPGWDAVFTTGHRELRKTVNKRWRMLERVGRVAFTEVTAPDAVAAALPAMFALFGQRWVGRHASGGFTTTLRPFHERAAVALAAAGHVRLSLLTMDDAVVAFAYGLRTAGVTTGYVVAHANALNPASPGTVLLTRLLEAACTRGDAAYDFSIGKEAYKDMWATGARRVFRVLHARRTPMASGRVAARRLATQAWTTARSVEWLRTLKRDGLRRALARGGEPPSAADTPGLPAGHAHEWIVCQVPAPPDGVPPTTARWSYAEMTRRLSPRLLALAVDRTLRGDVPHAVLAGDQLLGLVFQAAPGRRTLVTGGVAVPDDAAIYYHPVAAPPHGIDTLLAAVARVAGAPCVVVAATPLPGATVLGRYPAPRPVSAP